MRGWLGRERRQAEGEVRLPGREGVSLARCAKALAAGFSRGFRNFLAFTLQVLSFAQVGEGTGSGSGASERGKVS